jgi:membrane associated rhomboid family serine protease
MSSVPKAEWEALKDEVRLGKRALLWPLAIMWGLEIPNFLTGGRLNTLGVWPRTPLGLLGILFSPLLHGGWGHLIGNTIGWLIAGTMLVLYDARKFLAVMAISWVTAGLGEWTLGASGAPHIGASGVIFGFFGYLLVRGWVKKSLLGIAASVIFGSAFGMSMLLGLVPQGGISWQGHLFGLIGGVLAAFLIGRKAPQAPSRA